MQVVSTITLIVIYIAILNCSFSKIFDDFQKSLNFVWKAGEIYGILEWKICGNSNIYYRFERNKYFLVHLLTIPLI